MNPITLTPKKNGLKTLTLNPKQPLSLFPKTKPNDTTPARSVPYKSLANNNALQKLKNA